MDIDDIDYLLNKKNEDSPLFFDSGGQAILLDKTTDPHEWGTFTFENCQDYRL